MDASNAAIAVSGLSVAGSLAPGMPVVQSIRAEPSFAGSIIGFSHDPLNPPNYDSALLDRVYLVPYPRQGVEQLYARIAHANSRQKIDVIIPTLDSELPLYIELRPRLDKLGIGTVLPDTATLNLRSKIGVATLAPKIGLRSPFSRLAQSYDDVVAFAREFALPFMLKGHYYGAILISSYDHLPGAASTLASAWGYPLVLQEYIHGTEYDTAALSDRNGRLLGAVPMKKLQLDPQGKAWGGMTIDDPVLVQAARQAAAELKWPGPFELEIMRHAVTGDPYLIEINPRFPAWIQLAVAAGQNLPWALARLACGEPVKPFEGYNVGVMSLRRSVDVPCPPGVYEALVMDGEIDHRAPAPNRLQPYWVKMQQVDEKPARKAARTSR